MSELPEDDERVQDTLRQLMWRLGTFIGETLTDTTMYAIRSTIEQTRTTFKTTYGYDFPLLAPLILPRSQFIAWFRQDLDNDEIRIKVLNLLREFSIKKIPVHEYELAQAMKFAWPNYNSDGDIEYYRQAKQVTLLQ